MFYISDKNLAPEGKGYHFNGVIVSNAHAAIDGNTARKFSDSHCLRSSSANTEAWLRIDFVKFVEVHTIKIWPGKLEREQEWQSFGCSCQ